MLKKINNFYKKNTSFTKINSKLLSLNLSLIILLQIATPSHAGLCGSKPVVPENKRSAVVRAPRRALLAPIAVAPTPIVLVPHLDLEQLARYNRLRQAYQAMVAEEAAARAAAVAMVLGNGEESRSDDLDAQ